MNKEKKKDGGESVEIKRKGKNDAYACIHLFVYMHVLAHICMFLYE
jgi:hypothetical protein